MGKEFWMFRAGVLVVARQGCVLLSHTEFSVPSVSRQNSEAVNKTTLLEIMKRARINLEGASIAVWVPNSRHVSFFGLLVPVIPFWGNPPAEAPFFVSVLFDSQKEEFSFDPALVVFRTAEGKEIYPAGFSGPSSPDPDCSGVRFPDSEEDSRKSKMACWRLMFDVIPPQPEEKFVIHIGGVKKSGNQLPPHPLSYEKVSGWLLHVWPLGMTYFW